MAQKEINLIEVWNHPGVSIMYKDEESETYYILKNLKFGHFQFSEVYKDATLKGAARIETAQQVLRICLPQSDEKWEKHVRDWLINQYVPRLEIEIKELKSDWLNDPIYNLELAPGFERHYYELREFSELAHKNWELKRIKDLRALAEALGVPGNTKLAGYVQHLEFTIKKLNERVEKLEGIINA